MRRKSSTRPHPPTPAQCTVGRVATTHPPGPPYCNRGGRAAGGGPLSLGHSPQNEKLGRAEFRKNTSCPTP